MALVEWTEPIGNTVWSYVPRCEDRSACRERVELVNREAWPVNDRTPVPHPAPQRVPLEAISLEDGPGEPFHHPEPDPPAAPEPEEAGSWLG